MGTFVGHYGLKSVVQKAVLALGLPLEYRAFHPYRALQARALDDTLAFIGETMPDAVGFDTPRELMDFAVASARATGFVAEFGVNSGGSINHLAKRLDPRVVHGFDSFEGLPEDWSGNNFVKGEFARAGRLPKVRANVRLHAGWFDATLPRFLEGQPGPAALLHVDCDLYSSTRTVLETLAEAIVPGTVILFDEYFNYPNWRRHEHQAFTEFLNGHGRRARYLGYAYRQVAVAME
jgi:hypothetical protein